MHRDTKLGLALGVLLVGVVGAMFFRNERDPHAIPPRLETAQKLDAQIAEKAITPYLTGVEPEPSPPAQLGQEIIAAPSPTDWQMPEFLSDDEIREFEQKLAGVTLGPPDPIPSTAPIAVDSIETPQNWEPFQQDLAPIATNAAPVAPITKPIAQSKPISVPIASSQQAPPAYADKPIWHVVREGETLSGIAAQYLGTSKRFDEVYEANRDQLRSPHDMRAGMRIRIPQTTGAIATPIDAPTPRNSIVVQPITESSPATLEGIETGLPAMTPRIPAAKPAPQQSAPAPAGDDSQRRFVPARRSPLAPWRLNGRASLNDEFQGPRKRLSQAPPDDLPVIRPSFDFSFLDEADAAEMADSQRETPRLPLSASSTTQVDEAKTMRQ